jgi:hypothetical protein
VTGVHNFWSLPQDDGSIYCYKTDAATGAFRCQGTSRPFSEFFDADGVRVADDPWPYGLQADATLTASLETDARWVTFGLAPTYVPTLDTALLASFGVCTTDVCDFVGADPPKRNGVPIAPLNTASAHCGPVPLNGGTYFCTLSGYGPTDVRANAETPQYGVGCTLLGMSLTAFDEGALSAIPSGCTVSAGPTVEGVSQTGVVALAAGETSYSDGAAHGQGWSAGDGAGLYISASGSGCQGSRVFEVQWACGGD